MANEAPLKLTDIQQMLGNMGRGVQNALPPSLAFFMGSQVDGGPRMNPNAIDPRRLPFSDVSPQLRDQRQHSLANPGQHNPFSVFGAIDTLNRQTNTQK